MVTVAGGPPWNCADTQRFCSDPANLTDTQKLGSAGTTGGGQQTDGCPVLAGMFGIIGMSQPPWGIVDLTLGGMCSRISRCARRIFFCDHPSPPADPSDPSTAWVRNRERQAIPSQAVKTLALSVPVSLVALCVATPPSSLAAETTDHPTEALPPGFVHLQTLDPTILTEVRYAGAHNFIG